MKLPFGLQLKGVIVGMLLAYLVIPWVMSFLGGLGKGNAKD